MRLAKQIGTYELAWRMKDPSEALVFRIELYKAANPTSKITARVFRYDAFRIEPLWQHPSDAARISPSDERFPVVDTMFDGLEFEGQDHEIAVRQVVKVIADQFGGEAEEIDVTGESGGK